MKTSEPPTTDAYSNTERELSYFIWISVLLVVLSCVVYSKGSMGQENAPIKLTDYVDNQSYEDIYKVHREYVGNNSYNKIVISRKLHLGQGYFKKQGDWWMNDYPSLTGYLCAKPKEGAKFIDAFHNEDLGFEMGSMPSEEVSSLVAYSPDSIFREKLESFLTFSKQPERAIKSFLELMGEDKDPRYNVIHAVKAYNRGFQYNEYLRLKGEGECGDSFVFHIQTGAVLMVMQKLSFNSHQDMKQFTDKFSSTNPFFERDAVRVAEMESFIKGKATVALHVLQFGGEEENIKNLLKSGECGDNQFSSCRLTGEAIVKVFRSNLIGVKLESPKDLKHMAILNFNTQNYISIDPLGDE